MSDFKKEFEKFNLKPDELPRYIDGQHFASMFKKCSIYEYGTVSYTNTATPLETNKSINPKK